MACPAISEDRRDHVAAYERYCILDSDIVFFRDFDLSQFQVPNPIPLFGLPDEVVATQPRHSRWVETSHELLGLPVPPLPASDFIGHIIFWDRQTTAAMVAQIEKVTNLHWIEALCRTREFSEYMLYGYFVQNNAALFRRARAHLEHPVRQLLGAVEAQQGRIERVASPRRQGRRRLLDRVLLGHAG